MANSVDHGSRRSSIAALILLVLLVCAVAVNYFLWRWGDTQTQHAASAQARLFQTQRELLVNVEKAQLMKSMLGLGALTKAELDALKQAGTGDPDIAAIASNFARDMDLFDPDVKFQNRNYPALAHYLDFAIKNCRSAYEAASETANDQDR